MAVVVMPAMAVAVPAGANNVLPEKSQVGDFVTAGLDANGQFKLVHCTEGKRGVKADKIKESYKCMFLDDSFLGPPALPAEGMTWDYASSAALHDDFFGIDGPYRWFSDIEDIVSGFDLCWLYSTDWEMKIRLHRKGECQGRVLRPVRLGGTRLLGLRSTTTKSTGAAPIGAAPARLRAESSVSPNATGTPHPSSSPHAGRTVAWGTRIDAERRY